MSSVYDHSCSSSLDLLILVYVTRVCHVLLSLAFVTYFCELDAHLAQPAKPDDTHAHVLDAPVARLDDLQVLLERVIPFRFGLDCDVNVDVDFEFDFCLCLCIYCTTASHLWRVVLAHADSLAILTITLLPLYLIAHRPTPPAPAPSIQHPAPSTGR